MKINHRIGNSEQVMVGAALAEFTSAFGMAEC